MDKIITEKICTKCGEVKDVSSFVKDPQKKDGLYSSCKECYKINYKKNIVKAQKRSKEYKDKNRDTVLAKKRARWLENREYNLKKLQEYHKENKEKEKLYRIENKEKLSLISRAWAALNSARRNDTLKKWRRANPDKVSVQKQNRRTREAGNVISNKEWEEVLEKYGNRCLCCGRSDVRITMDHVLPLSKGGTNTIDNVQPLCFSCNSRKSVKHIDYR